VTDHPEPTPEEAVDRSVDTPDGGQEGAGEAAHVRKFRKELNAGTVSLVLLALLDRSERAMYGYEIARVLEGITADGAEVKQGTLYPVLRSLEGAGFLESSVQPSVSGPPRKYYQVTGSGREALTAWLEVWQGTRRLVDAAMEWEPTDEHDR
jgi:PadR family transcriptional regulator PadR